jgi:hypothetical protein
MRAPTWCDPNAGSGNLPESGSPKWRVDLFHLHLFTADSVPVHEAAEAPVVSTCPTERNELIFFLRDFCSIKQAVGFPHDGDSEKSKK